MRRDPAEILAGIGGHRKLRRWRKPAQGFGGIACGEVSHGLGVAEEWVVRPVFQRAVDPGVHGLWFSAIQGRQRARDLAFQERGMELHAGAHFAQDPFPVCPRGRGPFDLAGRGSARLGEGIPRRVGKGLKMGDGHCGCGSDRVVAPAEIDQAVASGSGGGIHGGSLGFQKLA